jgi:calcineurin-like phosphoesterase family protein
MHKHRVHCWHTKKQELKAIEINQEKTFLCHSPTPTTNPKPNKQTRYKSPKE